MCKKPYFEANDSKSGKKYSFFKCQNCKLVQIYPTPGKHERQKIYFSKRVHQDFLNNNPQAKLLKNFPAFKFFFSKYQQLTLSLRIKHTLKYIQQGKILDIGFGDGKYLSSLNGNKWDIWGIEINQKYCQNLKKQLKYSHLYSKNLESLKLPTNYFDLITLWHVFEHLDKPQKTINKIQTLMSKNGYLIIEVPNANSLYFHLFKQNWQQLIIPEHLFFYSEKSIRNLLQKSKFKIIKITFHGLHSFSAISSLSNLLQSIGVRSQFSALISLFILPFAILVNILSFKMQENMLIVAQKR